MTEPTSSIQSNLPLMLAPLIGREQEQADLRALIETPAVRLITLTGPGGVGKTRLAIEVGRQVAPAFSGGVTYIALDPVRDFSLVLPTIAQALGLASPGQDGLLQELATCLGQRQLLLVLDNFEQVEDAAGEMVQLLGHCGGIKILATSRISLGVYGEREFPLAPLPLPSPEITDDLPAIETAAVRLFVERALEVEPRFRLTGANAATVAEICRRLDGFPLAIELAAARIKALSPETLLDRLSHRLDILTAGRRDLPQRQRTMRDAIAWSHDLLTPDERTLFRRLAVFSNGFTLEAAEAVCGTGESIVERRTSTEESSQPSESPERAFDSVAVLDGIAALVDESLVTRGGESGGSTRYAMYQTIVEFAAERLAESGEETAIRAAHAEYFSALGERIAPELIGAEQNRWFDWLEIEHDNFRAALAWAIGQRRVSLARRIGATLWRFWWVRGYIVEGDRWFARILELGGDEPTVEHAMTLYGAGTMAEHLGDYDRAPRFYQAALDLARRGGHDYVAGQATSALALVAQDQGRYDEAIALHQEARAIFARIGNIRGSASTIHNLGSISYYQGDVVEAEARYTEALGLVRQIGDERAVSMIVGNLGVMALARCDFGLARQYQEEALALTRAAKDDGATGIALINLGDAERFLGNLDHAETYLQEALRLLESLGAARQIASARHGLGRVAQARGDSTAAVEHLAKALDLANSSRDSAAIAACLEALGAEAATLGDPDRGARLIAAGDALRTSIGSERTGAEIGEYERTLAAVRLAAGPERFDAAWAAGTTDTLDASLQLAAGLPALLATANPDSPADDEAARRLGLTRRELDVLRLFVAGKPTAEIAGALAIPPATVTTLVGNLYTKFAVDSRAGVTATAFKHGLV